MGVHYCGRNSHTNTPNIIKFGFVYQELYISFISGSQKLIQHPLTNQWVRFVSLAVEVKT